MSVRLTSEAFGAQPGTVITRSAGEEEWLLANGYAKRDSGTSPTSYTGPGVANTGTSDVVPAKELTDALNREPAPAILVEHRNVRPDPNPVPYDYDPAGVNDDALGDFTVDPDELPLAGGPVVITGTNFDDSTGVTFGGTAGTGFKVVSKTRIEVTAPAKTAGSYAVVVQNPAGNKSMAGAVTYAD